MAESDDLELGPVVDIDHTVQLLLNPSRQRRPGSISMVPSIYRDLSPSSYTPRVVSIGPLHHEDKHLKGFEVHKATYMHNLLDDISRLFVSTPEQILRECVTKVSSSIDRIKACYFGMKAYTDSDLVKMMVTDACFILAFIYNRTLQHSSLGQNNSLYPHTYLDMVLIENQIPFFVLQDIYDCTYFKHNPPIPIRNPALTELVFQFAKYFYIFEGYLERNNNLSIITSTHYHILDFLQKFYQNPDGYSSKLCEPLKAHPVVELARSGVRFSAMSDAEWPMAMKLEFSNTLSWGKPTLKMPVLRLFDDTETIIRNLIIHEQSSEVITPCVTSYMYAMDMLIDTPEDVAKLVRSKVLVNYLGSTEEAADIINNICKEVSIYDFCYTDEWKQMDDYYNAYWPNLIAELRRKYFSNPWSVISLLAGVVLFFLTVIQTFYAVKGGIKD